MLCLKSCSNRQTTIGQKGRPHLSTGIDRRALIERPDPNGEPGQPSSLTGISSRPAAPGDPYHLVLPAHETKNGQPLEFCLSDHPLRDAGRVSIRALSPDLRKHAPDHYLYPGQNGRET